MSNFDIFNWQPSADEVAKFAEQLKETEGGRQLLEIVDRLAPVAEAAAAPAAAAPATAATITGTLTRAEQKEIFIEQRREELQAQGKPVDEAKLEARFRELAKTPDGREQIATVVQRAAPEIMQAVAPTKVEIPAAAPAAAAPAAAAPAAAAPATTYDPTRQMVVPVEQARVATTVTPTRATETQTPATALAAANRARLADVEAAAKAAIQRGGSTNQTRVDELVAGVKSGIYSAADALAALGAITAPAGGDGDGETPEERIARLDREESARQFAAAQAAEAALVERQRVDAFARLRDLLNRVGLSALEGNVRGLIARGITDSDAILFELRDTPTFQTRFKANAARVKKGLPELDPATYVGLEQAYRDVLASNNLPPTFYDDQDDFNAWIEGEVAPSELQARITEGYEKVRDADPGVKAQMQRLYGVTESELAAYFIDPKRAKPLFDSAVARRQAQAAQIAARGVEMAGLELSAESAEDLVRRGYTPEEAQRVFAERAQLSGLYERMGGEEMLTPEQELGATFGYDVQAQQALERRRRQRVGEFQAGGQFARTSGATSGTVETGLGGPQ